MSRTEFAERYGAAADDLAQVQQFAQEHGLSVIDSDSARRTVWLSGTVAQMNRAFAVDLGRYESDEGSYRGREGHILLPAGLANIVDGVFGLDNRRMAKPLIARAQAPNASISPLTPPEVATLYEFPKGSANGQTIGLLEFGGGYLPGDIRPTSAGWDWPLRRSSTSASTERPTPQEGAPTRMSRSRSTSTWPGRSPSMRRSRCISRPGPNRDGWMP